MVEYPKNLSLETYSASNQPDRRDGMKNHLVILLTLTCLVTLSFTAPGQARVWTIQPDGTGDAPTIQAGIDSAVAGDIVEVACGTYYEHDLVMKTGITLRSETGLASCAIIDAQQLGRGILCLDIGPGTFITGLMIIGGVTTGSAFPDYFGGGLCCHNGSPEVTHCHFTGNAAYGEGGAVACIGGASPTFTDCLFTDNAVYGNGSGGAMVCWDMAAATLEHCLFNGNSASVGGGLFCWSASATLDNCSVNGNQASTGGGIALASGSSLSAYNTDILNNTAALGADGYIGYESQALLTCCEVDTATFTVEGGSLILDNEDCGGVIKTKTDSWGGMKDAYR
jgi:hypothetical protein